MSEVGVAAGERAQQLGRLASLANPGVGLADGFELGEEGHLPQERFGFAGESGPGDVRPSRVRRQPGLLQGGDHFSAGEGFELFDELVDVHRPLAALVDLDLLFPRDFAVAGQAQSVGGLGAHEDGGVERAGRGRDGVADRLVARGKVEMVAGGDEQRLSADLAQEQAVVGVLGDLGGGSREQERAGRLVLRAGGRADEQEQRDRERQRSGA